MKKIIKPVEPEEVIYYSDFSGKEFGECGPDIEIKINFNYGSKYDGSRLHLHLFDDEFEPFLNLIKKTSSENFKDFLQKKLELEESNYEDAMQMRDWDACDQIGNNVCLYRDILKS